jgi:hypothetical protein
VIDDPCEARDRRALPILASRDWGAIATSMLELIDLADELDADLEFARFRVVRALT